MRRYETIFITHPELSEEELSELRQKVNSILTTYKGDLIKFDDWGTKKLTYEIRRNSRGHFFLMDYLAGTDLIRELERNLRLHDRILRFQTVRLGEQISPETAKTLKQEVGTEKTAKTFDRAEPPGGGMRSDDIAPEGGEKA